MVAAAAAVVVVVVEVAVVSVEAAAAAVVVAVAVAVAAAAAVAVAVAVAVALAVAAAAAASSTGGSRSSSSRGGSGNGTVSRSMSQQQQQLHLDPPEPVLRASSRGSLLRAASAAASCDRKALQDSRLAGLLALALPYVGRPSHHVFLHPNCTLLPQRPRTGERAVLSTNTKSISWRSFSNNERYFPTNLVGLG